MSQITLLDGGMSRELERHGAILRQPEWSALALMNQPETVSAAHEAFIRAGSRVVTTSIPPAASATASARSWVDLPAPSPPSGG